MPIADQLSVVVFGVDLLQLLRPLPGSGRLDGLMAHLQRLEQTQTVRDDRFLSEICVRIIVAATAAVGIAFVGRVVVAVVHRSFA